ncbi:MAG: nucleoside-diphosphate kinase [Candidatus Kerfeldbacteria bacterium RIFOXYA2_FULL_38_24]|uniref:Nucleoside diphosphate kinase n=1 Tax=Candidatus Kerfeldbacteria bacterium RIFOXYB2_FULL_38_14 TaxID=1798547 RepID=A0A1G2BEP8_9BACT|nr:MAG: nucleoside-diphosphate kinase [Candidatus Kerfeldbacteria bacterium RIFOXYB2_FULL_38_14]OGY87913.1 MAG: nucleoside-diphosphate kinase [Candidatus Kerfeldbacteria bacterium RIFOXYA2_FULL_38_24]OGY88672.1 MAG: nucleoside-diphosphate kinase [Candidatus Kerfeldbacteria bacterium RIFOXYC2_FULL_38_9]
MEQTLIIVKPDALQRNLLGEIIHRFERKGLRLVGLKMARISDLKVSEHYAHHKDKPFFDGLKRFMQSAPVVLIVLEGLECVEAVRFITGATKGRSADAGTIRGDFAMSMQANIVHASDSPANAQIEIKRFFDHEELFQYERQDKTWVYSEDEIA